MLLLEDLTVKIPNVATWDVFVNFSLNPGFEGKYLKIRVLKIDQADSAQNRNKSLKSCIFDILPVYQCEKYDVFLPL